MGQIKAQQIDGLAKYGSGQTWWPDAPEIAPVAENVGGGGNDIVTLVVVKKNSLKPLEFKMPVDYIDKVKGEYYETNQLDTPLTIVLTKEKDDTYPFAVLVYYDYANDQVLFLEGEATDAEPVVPDLPADSIMIGVHIIPIQGEEYTQPVTPAKDYFKTLHVTLPTSQTYYLSFEYSQIHLTIPAGVTINLKPNTAYTPESNANPEGKTLIVKIKGTTATINIVDDSYIFSDSTIAFSTNSSKSNLMTFCHEKVSGADKYRIDNTVYNG